MSEKLLKELLFQPEEVKAQRIQERGENPLEPHTIYQYAGVQQYKSVWRAMRRGHVSLDGTVYPNRPFSNSKASSKRKNRGKTFNEFKKEVYAEQLRQTN